MEKSFLFMLRLVFDPCSRVLTASGIPTWSKAEKSMAVMVRAKGAELLVEMDTGEEIRSDSVDEG